MGVRTAVHNTFVVFVFLFVSKFLRATYLRRGSQRLLLPSLLSPCYRCCHFSSAPLQLLLFWQYILTPPPPPFSKNAERPEVFEVLAELRACIFRRTGALSTIFFCGFNSACLLPSIQSPAQTKDGVLSTFATAEEEKLTRVSLRAYIKNMR